MQIFIKRDFTKEVEHFQEYFHVTKLSNLPNIQKYGLIPSKNRRMNFEGWRNRIYLSASKQDLDPDFIAELLTGSWSTDDVDIAVLKVKVPKTIQTYQDEEASKYDVFVEEPIPPENISVFYTGPLSKLPN